MNATACRFHGTLYVLRRDEVYCFQHSCIGLTMLFTTNVKIYEAKIAFNLQNNNILVEWKMSLRWKKQLVFKAKLTYYSITTSIYTANISNSTYLQFRGKISDLGREIAVAIALPPARIHVGTILTWQFCARHSLCSAHIKTYAN